MPRGRAMLPLSLSPARAGEPVRSFRRRNFSESLSPARAGRAVCFPRLGCRSVVGHWVRGRERSHGRRGAVFALPRSKARRTKGSAMRVERGTFF